MRRRGAETVRCVQNAVHVTARYDVYLWLDKRSGTLTRVPNPEHRLRLELEGRF